MKSRVNLVLTKPAARFSIVYPTRDVACRLLASARHLLGTSRKAIKKRFARLKGGAYRSIFDSQLGTHPRCSPTLPCPRSRTARSSPTSCGTCSSHQSAPTESVRLNGSPLMVEFLPASGKARASFGRETRSPCST
jgi:hypothetical protein